MADRNRITVDGGLRVTVDGAQRVIIAALDFVGANRDTLLTISGFGTMLYQARGLTQSLEVIAAAKNQGRVIDGDLIDVSGAQFRKYLSKITCIDSSSPPLDNIFPGMEVTVECACELCYLTGNPGSPARPEVPGSARTAGEYSFYRPILTMLVRDVRLDFDEWRADTNWEISLEEV